jgi:hypothetical protein
MPPTKAPPSIIGARALSAPARLANCQDHAVSELNFTAVLLITQQPRIHGITNGSAEWRNKFSTCAVRSCGTDMNIGIS